MSEMIENAAVALHADVCEMLELCSEPKDLWKNASADFRDRYRKRARVVIEAMREPTNGMCNAGTRVLAVDWDLSADGRIAPDVWKAMIDGALK